MNEQLKQYLSEIGRRGGQKSRRTLDSKTAKAMVALREARKAYKKFHARCFWSSPIDYVIQVEDIPWVVKQLKTHGGREGWVKGSKLCP